ncbi:MAG: hypothetical protein Q8S54_03700 [Bacteroidota bacterium]|nr:hypothetical protein [Odoribacter sp.]MDP3642278.1 hypothetical protein [Bacteroidota bacterium]
MEQSKDTRLLNAALIIYIVIVLVYGIMYLLVPQVLVEAQGGEPVASGWLRWSGGVLIALGIGSIMVYRNPLKQDAFVVTIIVGCLLAGLALLYALLFELTGKKWFTALPMIVLLILTFLLWFGRQQAKDILCQKEK